MLFPSSAPFRCCLILLSFQVMIYLVFVFRVFSLRPIAINGTLVRYAETELYMNSELNLTDSKNDEECARNFLESYSRYCEKALVPSPSTVRQYFDPTSGWLNKDLCPCLPQNMTGRNNLNMSSLSLSTEVFSGLLPGGHWTPSWCIPRQRIALIIPFRDRASHLDTFLQIFHPFLQKQLHRYSIFVIEQAYPVLFNKAAVMNVGFVEIIKRTNRIFDCFIFHDVDTLPQDDRNIYGCYRFPKHVAAYFDKFNYRLHYYKIFGGATAFTRRQFELSNGYSNEFWGWGGEDDDMEKRIAAANFSFIRFPKCVAKYTMIRHDRDKDNPRNKRASVGWYYRPEVYKRDGLNTLKYTLNSYEERLLYTKIVVSLPLPTKSTAITTRKTTNSTTKATRKPIGSATKTTLTTASSTGSTIKTYTQRSGS